MLDKLRDRIVAYISQHRICIISTSGSFGAWAIPAWHHSRGLEIYCLLPRWSDALYHLEQDPRVMLVILDTQSDELRWLQYCGIAHAINSPDWDQITPQGMSKMKLEDRYIAIHITPERIDLIDDGRVWGARETLDI